MEDAMPGLKILVDSLEQIEPLNEEARAAILSADCVVRSYAAGRYVLRENDRADFIGIAIEGFAFSHKQTSSGSRQVLSLILPGEALALENIYLNQLDCSIQALTTFSVGLIHRDAMKRFMMLHPTIANGISTMLAYRSSIYKEWMLNIGRRNAKERVGHLLCEIAVRLTGGNTTADRSFKFPLTQEQIGDALGLTAAHVNRAMKSLRNEGLLIKEKTLFKLPEWDKLCVLTDFNDGYLINK